MNRITATTALFLMIAPGCGQKTTQSDKGGAIDTDKAAYSDSAASGDSSEDGNTGSDATGARSKNMPSLVTPLPAGMLPLATEAILTFSLGREDAEIKSVHLAFTKPGETTPAAKMISTSKVAGSNEITASINAEKEGLQAGLYDVTVKMALQPTDGTPETWSETLAFSVTFAEANSEGGNDCLTMAPQVAALAELMIKHPEQGRGGSSMRCDDILQREAMHKAKLLSQSAVFGHVINGYGPNYSVQHAGMYEGDDDVYLLPAYYGDIEDKALNFIESVSSGQSSAAVAFEDLLNSAGHRDHILGLTEFWSEQKDYGIGYHYDANSVYKHYWVILTATH